MNQEQSQTQSQSPSPAAIVQLVQQAIRQTEALQATESGWQAVKLQQTQTLLTAAMAVVQTVVEADPEWEALLQEAANPIPD